jgi:hypothetical protein
MPWDSLLGRIHIESRYARAPRRVQRNGLGTLTWERPWRSDLPGHVPRHCGRLTGVPSAWLRRDARRGDPHGRGHRFGPQTPLASIIIALIVSQAGLAIAPLIIVAVAVAYITTLSLDVRRGSVTDASISAPTSGPTTPQPQTTQTLKPDDCRP